MYWHIWSDGSTVGRSQNTRTGLEAIRVLYWKQRNEDDEYMMSLCAKEEQKQDVPVSLSTFRSGGRRGERKGQFTE